MTTITIPPEIEGPLVDEARRRGTTPELLVLDGLRRLFASSEVPADPPSGGTLFDFLAADVGAINGTTEALSENCGERFAKGLVNKQQGTAT